jgi:hypothetical protein
LLEWRRFSSRLCFPDGAVFATPPLMGTAIFQTSQTSAVMIAMATDMEAMVVTESNVGAAALDWALLGGASTSPLDGAQC